MFLLGRVDARRRRREGVNDRIKRLTFEDSKVPQPISAMVRAIIALRNEAEYEQYCLSPAEAQALRSICEAIDEYAAKLPKLKT